MNLFFRQSIPKEERVYIEKKGWEIASVFPEKDHFDIPEYPEALETYRLADVDFKGYENKKIFRHTYRLKQKCNGEILDAVVFSVNSKIIGSYIDIDQTVPGVTEMLDKDYFIHEICLYES